MGKRKRINEYYSGDPDKIIEVDDNTKEGIKAYSYSKSFMASFGWFQTSLDGKKEFIIKDNTTHLEIAAMAANKLIGKAMNKPYGIAHNITEVIYDQAAYCGRIFFEPRVIATWKQFSSEKLQELIGNIGGIDAYGDFDYTYRRQPSVKVVDYIKMGVPSKYNHEEENMNASVEDDIYIGKEIWDTIRQYNVPSSKLADKTSKLGNMTIAQYNSLIHQEGKKIDNKRPLIKENKIKMKDNAYQKEFSNYIEIIGEALKRDDFKAYGTAKLMLEEAIDEKRRNDELMGEMKTYNFGILNHIFEEQLPTLIKTNKKGVRDVIKTIKEDKNLQSEFSFYNVIKEQYRNLDDKGITANIVLEKLAEISVKDIDQDTVKESNKKLRKVMVENDIYPISHIDDELRQLYESGHIILTRKKTSNNMIPLIESYNNVCQYMDRHKNDKINEGKDIDKLIEEFEGKLKGNLNESEMSFVQQITDFKSPMAEQRKEKLFTSIKNDCVKKIDEMMKADGDNESLKSLERQIDEMKYSKDSIVGDIAKLLEIRDILMDD